VLGVDEIDRPEPDDDEVLVEMRAASVNPVDVLIRSGEYGKVPLPSVPGGDGAGVVVTAGDDVDRFREGDRVIASGMDRESGGTFAEMDNHPVRRPALERLGRLLRRGDLTGVVADTYDLDEVAQAHRDVLAGGYVGKLVVTP
jgi:NADPH:quinone reductase-like Zn-dependent oxidoreductase